MLRPGLAALVEHLMMRDYSSHAIGRIFDFVACNGTLEGSLVEDDDMAAAEAIFVDELPKLTYENSFWGWPIDPIAASLSVLDADDDEWICLEDDEDELARIAHEAPDGPDVARKMQAKGVRPVSGDSPDWGAPDGPYGQYIPPITGGAPAYEPTPADLAEYAAWSEHLERLRDIQEQRRWWAANPLTRFNAERTD
jgi:hypothetical protein